MLWVEPDDHIVFFVDTPVRDLCAGSFQWYGRVGAETLLVRVLSDNYGHSRDSSKEEKRRMNRGEVF